MRAAVKRKVPVDYVEATRGICGGAPRVRGTRIRVSQIASEYEHMGMSPDEVVEAHPHLSLAEVHAALTYYYDHRNEIQTEWQAADILVESLKRRVPSPSRLRTT